MEDGKSLKDALHAVSAGDVTAALRGGGNASAALRAEIRDLAKRLLPGEAQAATIIYGPRTDQPDVPTPPIEGAAENGIGQQAANAPASWGSYPSRIPQPKRTHNRNQTAVKANAASASGHGTNLRNRHSSKSHSAGESRQPPHASDTTDGLEARSQEVQALQAEVAMQEVQLRRLLTTRPGEEISNEVAIQAAKL